MPVSTADSAADAVIRPKYRQVREALLELIASLPGGAGLPSERELCERFGFARGTVRHALDRLAAEQRVFRQQGRGTFVARKKIDQPLELSGHTEYMRLHGHSPGSRIIEVSRCVADAETASLLGLAEESEILRVERVRLVDDEPVALENVALDATRFGGLEGALGASGSLYELLETRFAVRLGSAEETIEAVPAGEREADLLGIPVGAPVLLLCRLSIDDTERPIEYVRALYRADRFRFRTRLQRAPKLGLPPGTRLRTAHASDAAALAHVFITAWQSGYVGVVDKEVLDALDPEEITDWLATLLASAGTTTFVVESPSGEALAFSRVGEDPADSRRGHIFSLYVAPAARRRGIASALMDHALGALGERGLNNVTLWVFEQNAAARRMYARFGFAPDGARRVEPEYGAREVRLVRNASLGVTRR